MMRSSDAMRIVVLGYIVRGPLGGLAWNHLHYCLGLARLGHDVHFIEDSDDYPACYDPGTGAVGTDCTFGLRFATAAFERLGLGHRWAYFDAHSATWRGPAAPRALRVCAAADVVLNLAGVNPLRSWLDSIPVRVLVDMDPAFTQVRHLTDPVARAHAAAHTAFFTFGEAVGGADHAIPDDGFPWQPTRQPVVIDAWRSTAGRPAAPYTTVMQWDSYAVREHGGTRYGMKSDSFAPLISLPQRVDGEFELALGSSTAPRSELRRHGWRVCDPLIPTRDPWAYQRYIRGSKGEFSVAKQGYVVSRSGWFSERSACYLASGRPVIVEDTGFSRHLPVGDGLCAFSDLDSAIAAVEAVNRRYAEHCTRAREVAGAYFDASRVLSDLLSRAAQQSG